MRQVIGRAVAASLVAVALAGAIEAAPASAGEFPVKQCRGSGHESFFGEYGTPSTVDRVDAVNGCGLGGPGKIGVYQDRSGPTIPFGAGGQFIWAPGTGIRIVGSSLTAKLREANGMRPSVFGSNLATGAIDLDGSEALDGETRTTRWTSAGSFANLVVARLMCVRKAGCANAADVTKAYFEVFDLEMTASDFIAPSLELSGSLDRLTGSGQWVRGSQGFSLAASDLGSGVARAVLDVNGFEVRLSGTSCARDRGGYATGFAPCPLSTTRSGQLDTSASPFREGRNTVRACVSDFAVPAESANRSCTEQETLLVDNTDPDPPVGLEVIGGSGWRADNGFSFSWTLPGDDGAPLSGAEYRVVALAGGP